MCRGPRPDTDALSSVHRWSTTLRSVDDHKIRRIEHRRGSDLALRRSERGRWLPRSGTVARGRQHGQGYVFAGRAPGGRWRAAPDPDDTRLAALRERRVPGAQRHVERHERAHQAAHAREKVDVGAARRALRRAEDAAERHALALADHQGGYRGRGSAAARRIGQKGGGTMQ